MKNKIILVGNSVINEKVIANLKEYFEVGKIQPNNLKNLLENKTVYALWIHFDTNLTDDYLSLLKEVNYLVTTTTGLTHISPKIQDFFGENLISLKNNEEFLKKIRSTAELTWQLIMYGNFEINSAFQSVKNGNWSRLKFTRKYELSGQSIGILGYGRLGQLVAGYAKSFGMRVFICDIAKQKNELAKSDGFAVVASALELINNCDIISIHASFDLNSKVIFEKNLLSRLKKPLLLVNTARSGFVDESAVVNSINDNSYLRYMTDVLAIEESNLDLTSSLLCKKSIETSRIKITPHIGGATESSMYLCENELARILIKTIKI